MRERIDARSSRSFIGWVAALALIGVSAGGCGDDETGAGGSGGAGPGATSGAGGATSAATGAGGTGGGTASAGGAGGEGLGGFDSVPADCDPLVPTQCGFPFPSDLWLVEDPATATGKRVAFGEATLPVHPDLGPIPPALVGDSDGFSTGQAPTTHLPGATVTGLPTQHDIARSLEAAESPTILLDLETGELVPHFSELDMQEDDPDERALMVRPVVRLRSAARYVVAIRHVVDAAGAPIAPTDGFRALRDDIATGDDRIESRRARYEEIFGALADAGVARDDLQIAWDFTTASAENDTAWLLHMRDVALDAVGADGPAYVIDTVIDDPNEQIARRIEGRFTVPLFLDSPDPGGALVFGDDGLPEVQGTAEYTFVVQVPNAATTGTPGAILQTGHGLLGSWDQGLGSYYAVIAEQGNFVHGAVDMIGMAQADQVTAVEALTSDPMVFRPFFDRQLQGMTNQLVFMRMMKGAFAADPVVDFGQGSAIDTSEAYYRGSSQGGIFGATYMALSTDVTRGVLDVPGAPYNLLLQRSVDFEPFSNVMAITYPASRDRLILLGLLQMLWDRVEPNGYLPFLRDQPLPGTPPHEVLLHVAIGDHQVTPLGAHYMARTIGARLVAPATRPVFGLEEATPPFQGSAIVEVDYGDLVDPLPDTNVPTDSELDDPHGWPRAEPWQIEQSEVFLRTGVVTHQCEGPCDPR
jgi:hypothetical protein